MSPNHFFTKTKHYKSKQQQKTTNENKTKQKTDKKQKQLKIGIQFGPEITNIKFGLIHGA